MTEQPEQLMSHGSDIAMTNSEQSVMRRKLLAYTLTNPPRTSRVAGPFSWARRHAVAASMLVVLVAAGATGVSANMAGPNELLYDFKLGERPHRVGNYV